MVPTLRPDDVTMARSSVKRSGYTVLVVDDQEEMLRSTKRLLEREGHRVLVASSGPEALELFRTERPQLLTVDYFMPGMTGEELIRQIRREDETVQILLQTGYSGEKPAREMLDRLDIQGYHDKNDGADRFLVWVRVCLKAHRHLQCVREAERLKGELLANMSHEIRTPLTVSLGSLELVLDGVCGSLTDRAREMLGRVQSNTTALLSLVSDLLDLAKLETRAAEPRLEPMALSAFHGEAKDAIERHAGGKAIEFHWDVEDHARVRADRSKLGLVLSQVLASAVGGMSAGGVYVRSTRAVDGSVALVVSYPVSEGGEPPPDASRNGQTRDAESQITAELTTIALGIARRVARGMGGDLTMRPGPGDGATFSISLPAAAQPSVEGFDERPAST